MQNKEREIKKKKKDIEDSKRKTLKFIPFILVYNQGDEVTEIEMLFGKYQLIWALEGMIGQIHTSSALLPKEDNLYTVHSPTNAHFIKLGKV